MTLLLYSGGISMLLVVLVLYYFGIFLSYTIIGIILLVLVLCYFCFLSSSKLLFTSVSSEDDKNSN